MESEPGATETLEIRRFECRCGRHVATELGSDADQQGRCSRCRRVQAEFVVAPLTR